MNELIEKLKDKKYVRAFGLMEETLSGSRECFKKVGKKNCLCFHGGQWGGTNNSNDCFNYQYTYAIKPDYQPEPEFVDLEIREATGILGVYVTTGVFRPLYCLPGLPNFRYFWYVNLAVGTEARTHFAHVARKISDGKTVYARLRK